MVILGPPLSVDHVAEHAGLDDDVGSGCVQVSGVVCCAGTRDDLYPAFMHLGGPRQDTLIRNHFETLLATYLNGKETT